MWDVCTHEQKSEAVYKTLMFTFFCSVISIWAVKLGILKIWFRKWLSLLYYCYIFYLQMILANLSVELLERGINTASLDNGNTQLTWNSAWHRQMEKNTHTTHVCWLKLFICVLYLVHLQIMKIEFFFSNLPSLWTKRYPSACVCSVVFDVY